MRSKTLLTDDQLAAIGAVAVESTYTEQFVESLIVLLSGTSREKAEIMVGSKMMDGKLDVLKSLGLLTLESKKRKSAFEKIIEQVRRANTSRNTVIHGVWRQGPVDTTGLKPAKAANPRKKKAPTVSATKITSIATEISDAHNALFDFAFEAWISPRQSAQERAISRAQRPLQ